MRTGWRLVLILFALLTAAGCERMGGARPAQDATPAAPGPTGGDAVSIEHAAAQAYANRDWTEAERQYVLLTSRVPQEPEPWFRLGNVYARTARPELAVRAYQEAVLRNPKHTRAWHNMGVVQLRQAAASLRELERFGQPDDPLHQRAVELGDRIDALLGPAADDAP